MKNIVTLKLTKQHLQSVIPAFQFFDFSDDRQGNIEKSICEQIFEKLLKKALNVKDKGNKKTFTVNFQFYEAATFDNYLSKIHNNLYSKESLEGANLLSIYLQLNSKI